MAVFSPTQSRNGIIGIVFTKDGPFSKFAASRIIRSHKLPLRWELVNSFIRVLAGTKRNSPRNKRVFCRELVPDQYWEAFLLFRDRIRFIMPSLIVTHTECFISCPRSWMHRRSMSSAIFDFNFCKRQCWKTRSYNRQYQTRAGGQWQQWSWARADYWVLSFKLIIQRSDLY